VLARVLPLLARLGQADLGERSEAEGLLAAFDAVFAAPELAAGCGDEEVQAVAVVELSGLVAGLRVFDFLDRQHLGVFPGWEYFIPPNIPPERAQRPGITGCGEIPVC